MTLADARPARSRNEWRDAVWESDLKAMRRLAALCYADHAGEGNLDRVWVAAARGVERTGMGRTAWHESRNDLEATGLLHETQPAAFGGRSARYRLTIPLGQCRKTDSPRA